MGRTAVGIRAAATIAGMLVTACGSSALKAGDGADASAGTGIGDATSEPSSADAYVPDATNVFADSGAESSLALDADSVLDTGPNAGHGDSAAEAMAVLDCDAAAVGTAECPCTNDSDSSTRACQDQACVAGVCVGICAPGTSKCTSDTNLTTCDPEGQWQVAPCPFACLGAVGVAGGQCGGTCVPGGACDLSCAGQTLSHGTCDDAGACGNETMTDCTPYACAATGCKTRCTSDGDCASGFFCWQAACVDVIAISAGGSACAVLSSGALQCWGSNAEGQLGDGTTNDSDIPVPVSGLSSGVAAVSTSGLTSCALTTSGGVECWGYNAYGQLGDGSTNESSVPVGVTGLSSGVVAISNGGAHVCALTTSGGVECWGDNEEGELGDGTTTNRTTPVAVSGLSTGVAQIAAGTYFTCVLTTSGGVECWGTDVNGELGDESVDGGTPSDASGSSYQTTPVPVPGLSSGVAAITAGVSYACAIMTTGNALCWGDNAYASSGAPAAVPGLSAHVTAISEGGSFACALTSSGGVQCWGYNDWGQVGVSPGTGSDVSPVVSVPGLPSATAVSAGDIACARTAAGGVQCWGENNHGELGNGTTSGEGITAVAEP